MATDHSKSYKGRSIKAYLHRARLFNILKILDRVETKPGVIFDVGCSNGYITGFIAEKFPESKVIGWDRNTENLDLARQNYPSLQFESIDLNSSADFPLKADLVTCLETLEHVGAVGVAIRNLKSMLNSRGVLLISVPIESGFLGAIKYFVKTRMFGYSFNEISEDSRQQRMYEKDLLMNRDVSKFRSDREGWGTHFGFDYRRVEEILHREFPDVNAWTAGLTRFFMVKNQ
jgi:2-polyprenyl-3-methyl-5-hydroxy-6-metoxy-1,4-benzoquinol methylase